MKKIYFTITLFLIILLVSVASVFAANTTLTFNGTDSVTTGGTGKLTIQLTSSDVIGGVMGVISKNSNITNIEIVGKNGWNVGAFNKETGNFNIIKNEGATNEEILEIQYTVSNSTGTGNIDIRDITVSNVPGYDEEEIQAISKSISIVQEQEPDNPEPDNPEPDNPEPDNPEPDNPEPSDPEPSDPEPSDPSEKENPTNTNVIPKGTNTNIQKVDTKNTTSTTSKTVLPKTGIESVIISVAMVLVCILSVYMYLKYKKYKDVN